MIRVGVLLLSLLFAVGARAAPIENGDGFWSEWSDATFARAAAEKKFVVVSLQSWWCRWCHVMNRETWSNAEVRGVLKDKFIPVYVDQDSRPDISQRYERWGWPATIIFGPDGTEIAKLRGFYSPQYFIPVLTATIEDPSPVEYPEPGGAERGRTLATGLTDAQRDEILGFIDKAWDDEHGGWSKSKFVDGPMLTWALQRARGGDKENEARIKKVLTLMADTMIDKDVGAMNQVNLKPDWSEPAREFPMFAQEAALTAYARAVGDVRRSRLSAGRGPHLRFSQKHHGRARRRLLRLDGPERRRARRRQAAICARDRAGDLGPAGLLRRDRRRRSARSRDIRRALGAGQPRAARRRFPPRRAGQGRSLSRRQCRDGKGAAGAASLHGDARMADAGAGHRGFHRNDVHRSGDRRLRRLRLAGSAATDKAR